MMALVTLNAMSGLHAPTQIKSNVLTVDVYQTQVYVQTLQMDAHSMRLFSVSTLPSVSLISQSA
jgi:hypothetical protein